MVIGISVLKDCILPKQSASEISTKAVPSHSRPWPTSSSRDCRAETPGFSCAAGATGIVRNAWAGRLALLRLGHGFLRMTASKRMYRVRIQAGVIASRPGESGSRHSCTRRQSAAVHRGSHTATSTLAYARNSFPRCPQRRCRLQRCLPRLPVVW